MNQRIAAASRAFTLIELLVVVSIITLLIAILLPSLSKAREQSRRVVCATHLRQLATASIMYANGSHNRLPLINDYADARQMPAQWDKITMVDPLIRNGITLDLMTCPSTDVFDPPLLSHGVANDWAPWEYYQHNWAGRVNDYGVAFVYLGGLADPKLNKWYGSGIARWYDNPPSAADLQLADNRATSVMFADNNFFAGNEQWGFSNHADGPYQYWPQYTGGSYDDFAAIVTGGNRAYVDGSAEWVGRDRLGTNNTAILPNPFSAHYSFGLDDRPFWW